MNAKDEMSKSMVLTAGVFDEDGWKTINGAHVFIEGGSITKGPDALKSSSPSERDRVEVRRNQLRNKKKYGRLNEAEVKELEDLEKKSAEFDKPEAKKPEAKKPESKETGSAKASYKKGSYEDKGVKYDIDANGNRVAPGSKVPQVQVDISREDGSHTFWTIRNGKRVEHTVPRSADLDKLMPKVIKALGLNMDDCYVKYS